MNETSGIDCLGGIQLVKDKLVKGRDQLGTVKLLLDLAAVQTADCHLDHAAWPGTLYLSQLSIGTPRTVTALVSLIVISRQQK